MRTTGVRRMEEPMFSIAGEIELRGAVGGGLCIPVDSPLASVGVRYGQERRRRVSDLFDKASAGRVLDAAMDVLQFCSPGSQIADGARALGLVRDDVTKNALSAVVNGLLGGPLGTLAALGDGEDALQAAIPGLWRARQRALDLVGCPYCPVAVCASEGAVPSPQQQWRRQPCVAGYASVGHGQVDLAAYARSDDFRVALRAHLHFPTFGAAFGRDLPHLVATIEGGYGRASDNGSSSGDLANILRDPKLSFEDKLFYFMLAVAKNQEKKTEELMKKYDVAQAQRKKDEDLKKQVGQAQGMLGSIGSVAMAINPIFGLPLQSLNQVIGSIPEMAKTVDGVRSAVSGDKSGLTKEEGEWSEQRWMMELQREQEKLTKTYTLISNLMKAWSDTQMNSIRNLR